MHDLLNPVLNARCESVKLQSATDVTYSCEFGSGRYFALCGIAGMVSCGSTHTAMVPLDILKCRMQADPIKYPSMLSAYRISVGETGFRSLGRGWAPTAIGYSIQGLCKFGFYELFKVKYSQMVSEETAYLNRTAIYLAASASAEVIADIALCPMESLKVRMQTQSNWSTTLREGFPRIMREEGVAGFYKGLVPLWARQIPYTMMKFACFERTLEAIYKHIIPIPRSECSMPVQLTATFTAGYIAGVLCTLISHPADTIISVLNKDKGSNFIEVARRLGFAAMWKGLTPRIIMYGTLTAMQWFVYDGAKVTLGIPRPPPPEMPESLKRKSGL